MKVLIDTNVVLDLLLDRAPHADAAAHLFDQVERGHITACLCATTITTVHHIAEKSLGDEAARGLIGRLLQLVELAPVTRPVIERALKSPMSDFEDAVLVQSALLAEAQAIISRNTRDFTHSPLRTYTPAQWLAA